MTGCSEPGCDEPQVAHGLCRAHYAIEYRRRRRANDGQRLTNNRYTAPCPRSGHPAGDDVFMPCPDTLLELAGQAAELDARAIVRALWPHLLDASIAGVEAFTLEPKDAA